MKITVVKSFGIKVLDLQQQFYWGVVEQLLSKIPHEQCFTSTVQALDTQCALVNLKDLNFHSFLSKFGSLTIIQKCPLFKPLLSAHYSRPTKHHLMRDNDQTWVSQHISKENLWLLMCCNLRQGPLVPREGELGGLGGSGCVPHFSRSGRTCKNGILWQIREKFDLFEEIRYVALTEYLPLTLKRSFHLSSEPESMK